MRIEVVKEDGGITVNILSLIDEITFKGLVSDKERQEIRLKLIRAVISTINNIEK